jgi:hypothetical protein
MTALIRTIFAVALLVSVAGCVTPGVSTSTAPSAVVTPLRTKVIPAERATDAIVIGKSTRADVIGALGETLAISFDSGFEVWVYRLADETSGKREGQRGARRGQEKADRFRPGEFIVLFEPSGVVAKTRIRPPLPNETAGARPNSG